VYGLATTECVEDVNRNQLCGFPVLVVHDCPKPELLTLHAIEKMSNLVRQEGIHNINGGMWHPCKGAVICNIHHSDFKGPSKRNTDVIPVYFKAPYNHTSAPLPKRRRECPFADDLNLAGHYGSYMKAFAMILMLHNK